MLIQCIPKKRIDILVKSYQQNIEILKIDPKDTDLINDSNRIFAKFEEEIRFDLDKVKTNVESVLENAPVNDDDEDLDPEDNLNGFKELLETAKGYDNVISNANISPSAKKIEALQNLKAMYNGIADCAAKPIDEKSMESLRKLDDSLKDFSKSCNPQIEHPRSPRM